MGSTEDKIEQNIVKAMEDAYGFGFSEENQLRMIYNCGPYLSSSVCRV